MKHRGARKCKHRYRADAHYWNRLLNSMEHVRNWIGHNAEHSSPGKNGIPVGFQMPWELLECG